MVGLRGNGGVLTRVMFSLGWSKNPGTLEVMDPTDLQKEDAASQGSHLLHYLEQCEMRAMVASLVREGNQAVKHQGG